MQLFFFKIRSTLVEISNETHLAKLIKTSLSSFDNIQKTLKRIEV